MVPDRELLTDSKRLKAGDYLQEEYIDQIEGRHWRIRRVNAITDWNYLETTIIASTNKWEIGQDEQADRVFLCKSVGTYCCYFLTNPAAIEVLYGKSS